MLKNLLTSSASATRQPAAVGGVVGDPVASVASVECTAPLPLDATLRSAHPNLAKYHKVWQVIAASADVLEGDTWTQGGTEYHVVAVEEWPWRQGSTEYLRVLLGEDVN